MGQESTTTFILYKLINIVRKAMWVCQNHLSSKVHLVAFSVITREERELELQHGVTDENPASAWDQDGLL